MLLIKYIVKRFSKFLIALFLNILTQKHFILIILTIYLICK